MHFPTPIVLVPPGGRTLPSSAIQTHQIVDLTSATCRPPLKPVPHFHGHCREPNFQANVVGMVNRIDLTEAGIPPYILRDLTNHYAIILSRHLTSHNPQATRGASAAVQTLDPIRRGYSKSGWRASLSQIGTTPSWPRYSYCSTRRTMFLCAKAVLLAFAVQIKLVDRIPPSSGMHCRTQIRWRDVLLSSCPQPYIHEFGPYPGFPSLIVAQFHDTYGK